MIHNFTVLSRPSPTVNPLLSLTKLSLYPKFLLSFSDKMQSSNAARAVRTVTRVPGSASEEMERVAEQTLTRYTFVGVPQRKGKGVAIVWFRNDLRILDNEVLFKAWVSSEAVLPVYCVDPRFFATTHYFGFPKTGGMPDVHCSLSRNYSHGYTSVICPFFPVFVSKLDCVYSVSGAVILIYF